MAHQINPFHSIFIHDPAMPASFQPYSQLAHTSGYYHPAGEPFSLASGFTVLAGSHRLMFCQSSLPTISNTLSMLPKAPHPSISQPSMPTYLHSAGGPFSVASGPVALNPKLPKSLNKMTEKWLIKSILSTQFLSMIQLCQPLFNLILS